MKEICEHHESCCYVQQQEDSACCECNGDGKGEQETES